MKLSALFAAAVACFCFASPAQATYTHGQDMSASNMRTFGYANAPMGYLEFCRRFGEECNRTGRRIASINLTSERMQELKAINSHVNNAIQPVTDQELFNVTEKWTFPVDGKGDCEDYVLLKRKMLLDRGWPASSLLITVVRDQRGEGHAVLTVVTNKGDLILDNQRRSIREWHSTGYYYIKRQSPMNPSSWVSLRDVNYASSNPATAGAR